MERKQDDKVCERSRNGILI